MQGMLETRVWSLGREYPLEKDMATHSSVLACRIPWTEEPGGLQAIASQRVGHDWSDLARTHTSLYFFGGGEGGASLVAQMVKNLPAVQETRIWYIYTDIFCHIFLLLYFNIKITPRKSNHIAWLLEDQSFRTRVVKEDWEEKVGLN